jgi:uncharacterized protein YkwD
MSPRLLAAALAAAACAATPAPPARPAAAAPPAPREEQPTLYGAETPTALGAIEREVAAALRRAGAPSEVSPALVRAARTLARQAADGEGAPLAPARVRAALADAGAHDPGPLVRIASGSADQLPALLVDAADAGASHVGVGATTRGERTWAVAITARRRASVAPFPRRVDVGARHRLRGRLEGLAAARVVLATPDGVTREVAATRDATFDAAIPFDVPGTYVVEVVGSGPRGPEVAALLPVVAGGGAEVGEAAASRAREPEDLAAAEDGVLAELNALRLRHRLPPVAASAALRTVARRHSADMAAQGEVAHVLPGTGDLGARLRRAGVAYRRAVENVARASSGLEAHDVAAASPAHRANMLDPAVKVAGIGLARTRVRAGEPVVYLTQILLAPAERRDAD